MCTTSSELEKVLRRREVGLRSREVQKQQHFLACFQLTIVPRLQHCQAIGMTLRGEFGWKMSFFGDASKKINVWKVTLQFTTSEQF